MTTLLCLFFLFLVVFNLFKTIPVVKEKVKLKLALAVPTGHPTMLEKKKEDIHQLVADKTIKDFVKIIEGSNAFTQSFTNCFLFF